MLKRKIAAFLEEWKSRPHVPLLIKGQRQVGKTFIVEWFGGNHYLHLIKIDFSKELAAKDLFSGDLTIETLILNLKMRFGSDNVVPGETLIFLDEIQDCEEARSALKTFALDGRFDVIASGSLLGIDWSPDKDDGEAGGKRPLAPTGFEEHVEMFGLDFEEYLWACDVLDEAISLAKVSIANKKPIPSYILSTLEKHYKEFTIVGGMPASVNAFLTDHDFEKSAEQISILLNTCRTDINRYNKGVDRIRTMECFDCIPSQLAQSNKRYMYSRVSEGQSRKSKDVYQNNILWLKGAGYAIPCYSLTAPQAPLVSNTERDTFRVYMSDTGMLTYLYGNSAAKAIWDGNTSYNLGALAENAVADALTKEGYELKYYKKVRGESMMELDFVVEMDDGIAVVEVKSGKSRVAPSISKVGKYFKVNRRIMLALNSDVYVDDDGLEHYPLFAASFFSCMENNSGPKFRKRKKY